MEIEVGEYVRTKDGKIAVFDRYSLRKETSLYKSPFNCFIRLQNRKTPVQCCEDYILKHSKNIIDLIEVGDYVNGNKVIDIAQAPVKALYTEDREQRLALIPIVNEQIEIVVTKEQIKQIEYRIKK